MKHEHENKNKNKKILTLDLGTKTGWALLDQYNQINSGTQIFTPNRFQGGGMRYLLFKSWLDEINKLSNGIEQVYFEEVRRHVGVDAAHAYGGFLAHLSSWCEEKQVPYLGIAVGTIKKHITGKGNASKKQIIEAVKEKGFDPVDDNEADALSLMSLIIKKGGYNA